MELSSVLTLLSPPPPDPNLTESQAVGMPLPPRSAFVRRVLARPLASLEIHSQCLAKILTFGLNYILFSLGLLFCITWGIPALAWSLGDAAVK